MEMENDVRIFWEALDDFLKASKALFVSFSRVLKSSPVCFLFYQLRWSHGGGGGVLLKCKKKQL